MTDDRHGVEDHRIIRALDRANGVLHRAIGPLAWISGIIIVLNTIFEVHPAMYQQFAEYPRAAAFMFGFVVYVLGSEIRRQRSE